jgi:hydrogenase expression/formation protein HypE
VSGDGTIRLAHGSGGALMHELVETVIVRSLGNPVLNTLEDAAEIPDLAGHRVEGGRLAVTTDSYVVQPLFFPGGDIGTLAVSGTVNDLAVKGAAPAYLTLGLVVEEGFPVADLVRVLESIAATAKRAGVAVAAGDTKVVERGAVGGLIVNTAGVGFVPEGREISAGKASPGDRVLVTGTVGDHETAIVVAREGLKLRETIESDCAPIAGLIGSVLAACPGVHAMRDPTRGGLGTTLCEIAGRAGVGITIDEASIPLDPRVRSVCDILGFDPLYMASEGRAVIVVAAGQEMAALEAARAHELGRGAAVIGAVEARPGVRLRTRVGGVRPVVMLEGVQLPRIC